MALDPSSQELLDLLSWFTDEGCSGTTFSTLDEPTNFTTNLRWWASTEVAPGVRLMVDRDEHGRKFEKPLDAMHALKCKYLETFGVLEHNGEPSQS